MHLSDPFSACPTGARQGIVAPTRNGNPVVLALSNESLADSLSGCTILTRNGPPGPPEEEERLPKTAPKPTTRSLHPMLLEACKSLGIAGNAVVLSDDSILIAETGTAVLPAFRDGAGKWLIEERYEMPDVLNGGTRTVRETIMVTDAAELAATAKAAALAAATRLVDAAIDAVLSAGRPG
jgi:hypothetical protein